MTSFIAEHLLSNKVPYIVVVALVALGVVGGSAGQQWIDSRINGIVDIRLAGLTTDVSDIKTILLEGQLNDMKKAHCRTGSITLLNQIRSVQRVYEKMHDRPYELPSCHELGVDGRDNGPSAMALDALMDELRDG